MQYKHKAIKILQWNAQGITTLSVQQQLQELLDQENVDVVCLAETFLKPNHKFYLNNYIVYRNDRTEPGGGVAIAIKKTIQHDLLPLIKTSYIENVSISIKLKNKNIAISSVYSPNYRASFETDIKKITYSNKEFLIFGDFNARHNVWNCKSNNKAGKALHKLHLRSHFFIRHSGSPTHYPHSGRTPSTIDLLLTNTPIFITPLTSLDNELPSDHAPVICCLDTDILPKPLAKIPNYKRANWKKYQDFINSNINLNDDFNINNASIENIENSITKVTDTIIKAKFLAIPHTTKDNKLHKISKDTKLLIKQRNKVKRIWQRCTDSTLKSRWKTELNCCNKEISKNIMQQRNENWSQTLSKLKTADKKFWHLSKTIRGKYANTIGKLSHDNNTLISSKEKANCLAKAFEKAHNTNVNTSSPIDTAVRNSMTKFENENQHFINLKPDTYIKPNEIIAITKKLKNSKAPGIDGLQNILLKKLPRRAFVLIAKIFNACIKISYYPTNFKKAKVIPIPKPETIEL